MNREKALAKERRRKARRRELGLCVCGREREEDRFKLCLHCRKRYRVRDRNRAEKRIWSFARVPIESAQPFVNRIRLETLRHICQLWKTSSPGGFEEKLMKLGKELANNSEDERLEP